MAVAIGAVLAGAVAGGWRVFDSRDRRGSIPRGSVVARSSGFTPKELSVVAGAVVEFRNDDRVEHTFTADGGLFDSGVVAPGSTFRFATGSPRTIAFHCEIHPRMTGTVTVGPAT